MTRLLLLTLVMLTTLYSVPAAAQMACMARDSAIAKLSDTYGEARRGRGLIGLTAVIEIWASEATGTWTILRTTPNGLTCIMAAGSNWQDETIPTGDPA